MKAVRNSSFELLRIIMILMILIEHGNMWYIGSGYASIAEHWAKCIIESICIGAVNGFVLISGWFGIKSKLTKIGDLMFMVLFCTIPLLIVAVAFNWLPISKILSFSGAYEYVFGGNGYWFVIDYIGLLIIAPLLNKGIEYTDRRQFANILIAGYILIGFFDFVMRESILGTTGGYSVLWMGYLYMLARYMRIYGLKFVDRNRYLIFILSIALQSCLFSYGLIGLRYTNPLILLPAMSLICIFKHWNFQNKGINIAAGGALMAYLLHMQPILIPYIRNFLISQYENSGYWLYMVEMIGLSIGVYLIAILLNQLQAIIYKGLTNVSHSSNPDL